MKSASTKISFGVERVASVMCASGRSERKAVWSQLVRLLLHLIKQQIQPERAGTSWKASVTSARIEIRRDLEDSPSLRRYLADELQRVYEAAKLVAMDETGVSAELPEKCPYTLDELLGI